MVIKIKLDCIAIISRWPPPLRYQCTYFSKVLVSQCGKNINFLTEHEEIQNIHLHSENCDQIQIPNIFLLMKYSYSIIDYSLPQIAILHQI